MVTMMWTRKLTTPKKVQRDQTLFPGRRLLREPASRQDDGLLVSLSSGVIVDVIRYYLDDDDLWRAAIAGQGVIRYDQTGKTYPETVVLDVPADVLMDELQTQHYEATMAFSSYLTHDEWDACYYRMFVDRTYVSVQDSMSSTVSSLLAAGHVFHGLSATGEPRQRLDAREEPKVNLQKMLIFAGNPYGCDTQRILDNGREFLRRLCPAMVVETDDEWELKKAAESGRQAALDASSQT